MRSMMLLRAFLTLLLLALAPAARAQLLPAPARPLNATTMSAIGIPAPQGFTLVGTRTGLPTYPQNGAGLNQQSTSRIAVRFPAGASEIQLCYYGGAKVVATPQSTWTMRDVTGSGGTGYVVGQVLTLPATNANRAASLRVTQVSAGAFVKGALDDPGWYSVQLPDAFANTAGGGTGATFSAGWNGFAFGVSASIEPVWGSQTLTGPNAIVPVTRGSGRVVGTANVYQVDIMVPPSDVVCSDPVAVNIPVGGQIGLREFANGVSMGMEGGVISAADGWNLATDGSIAQSATFAAPMSGLIYNAGFVNSNFVAPVMILGRPKVAQHSFCFVGDSIGVGANGSVPATNGIGYDIGDADGARGWMPRGTASSYAYTNLSLGGDSWVGTLATPSQGQLAIITRLIALAGCDTVVSQMSINDFSQGQTAAQLLVSEQRFVVAMRAIPTVKFVMGATTTPYTINCGNITLGTSCPGLNTTVCASIATRNADLRNGLVGSVYSVGSGSNYKPLYDAVIDFGTVVETAIGSCLWQSAALGDGLHPSTAGHTLMGAVANAVFQAVLK
jgi:hypothetical protein